MTTAVPEADVFRFLVVNTSSECSTILDFSTFFESFLPLLRFGSSEDEEESEEDEEGFVAASESDELELSESESTTLDFTAGEALAVFLPSSFGSSLESSEDSEEVEDALDFAAGITLGTFLALGSVSSADESEEDSDSETLEPSDDESTFLIFNWEELDSESESESAFDLSALPEDRVLVELWGDDGCAFADAFRFGVDDRAAVADGEDGVALVGRGESEL